MEYDRAVCFHPVLLSVTYTLGHIMRNARLDELQVESIGGGNFNSLRHADDTTQMAESKEELKSLLTGKNESERAGLRLN